MSVGQVLIFEQVDFATDGDEQCKLCELEVPRVLFAEGACLLHASQSNALNLS